MQLKHNPINLNYETNLSIVHGKNFVTAFSADVAQSPWTGGGALSAK